jgi:hypothetical protein
MKRVSLAVLCLTVAGCHCNDKVNALSQCIGINGVQADHTDECMVNTECGDHFTCATPAKGDMFKCCVYTDRKCTTEADCCQGQTCTSHGTCFDKRFACTDDTACGTDQKCIAWSDPNYSGELRCRFAQCGTLGECPDGLSCFQGECMAGLPCEGTCPSGAACVPEADYCQQYTMFADKSRAMAACPMTCQPGFIATFKNNLNLWDTCDFKAVQCVCAELPSLHSEDLGRFSAIAVDPGKALWTSLYDGQYGDLVVYQYDMTGKRVKQEYVDGVPSGTPTYGPSGARGGVVDPGDDVGRYTDIAVGTNGIVYVSYYDATNGNLRFAYRTTDGKWTTMRVDGDAADLGLYTSVALDQSDTPGISYFQRGGDTGFNVADCPAPAPTGPTAFITALKYARAASPTPGAGDWTIKTIACQSAPTPACYQCNNQCADPGTGPACLMTAMNCTKGDAGMGCDPNTEVCVLNGSTPTCAKKYNPSNVQDVPQGVGVFTAMAFNGKDAFIAYMQRAIPGGGTIPKGALYGVHISTTGTPDAPVLLDGNGDTGFFPDVKIDPTTKHVAISYASFTSKALLFWTGTSFVGGVTPEVIDPGTGAAGSGTADWEGTDSALIYGTSGSQLYAVYQDPTVGDLKLAKRGTSSWTVLNPIETMGAVGFFADGVFDNGNLYASHARIHAKVISGEPHVDNALLLDTLPAP